MHSASTACEAEWCQELDSLHTASFYNETYLQLQICPPLGRAIRGTLLHFGITWQAEEKYVQFAMGFLLSSGPRARGRDSWALAEINEFSDSVTRVLHIIRALIRRALQSI